MEDTYRPKLRPSTFRSYSDIAGAYLLADLGRVPLSRLRREHVQEVLRKATDAGKAPRTVRNVRAVLRHALNQAIADGVLSRNAAAAASVPRASRGEAKTLSPEDARKLLEMAQTSRYGACYELMLTLGLRRGEALGLRWTDIDFEANTLSVRQSLVQVAGTIHFGEPKSDTSRRSLPMTPSLARSLKAHRLRQLEERLRGGGRWKESGLVFVTTVGTPIFPRNLLRDFQQLLKRAGLPNMRIHDLRHSAATLLLSQGVSPKLIQEILGHSQIGVTMDLSAHVMPTLLRDTVDKMEAVLRSPS